MKQLVYFVVILCCNYNECDYRYNFYIISRFSHFCKLSVLSITLRYYFEILHLIEILQPHYVSGYVEHWSPNICPVGHNKLSPFKGKRK